MGDALWWSAADARRATADPSWREALLGVPALVIDLRDEDRGGGPPGPPGLEWASCPVIALLPADTDETSWTADVSLTEGSVDVALLGSGVDEAAALLVDRAAANPTAAATLARVLRLTPTLDVAAALEVESLAYSMLLAGPEFRHWLGQRPEPPSRADEIDVVLVGRSGGVLHVTLNRPRVHNAFNAAMRDALVEALTVAELDWSVGTVELAGNGPSFCSGGDLGEFGTADDPVRAHLVRTTRSVAASMHRLRDRLTVRVHGACVGAGVELPSFARRVVAGEDATFRLPEVAMGLIPGAGGTVGLPGRIGPARTLLLALSGLTLPAADAVRWGLVDSIG
jgi:enoyl-CoA hydratase/isomerase-like protein